MKLLDVGCTNGTRMNRFKKEYDVYGIDLDVNKYGYELIEDVKDRLVNADATKPFPFNFKFHRILCVDTLEHIEDDYKVIKNISKSLEVGGIVILTTPANVPFFNWYDPAWVRWKFGGSERHKHYTKKELFGLFKKNNLLIEQYYKEGNLVWIVERWLNAFLKYVLESKKNIIPKKTLGFTEWVIIARRVRR